MKKHSIFIKKITLLIFFIFICHFSFSQLQETVTYNFNNEEIFKTQYDNNKIYFFRKDTLNQWYKYGWIEQNSYDILHYDGNDNLIFKQTWDNTTVYGYNIDSIGNEELAYKTEYIEDDIPTGNPDEFNPITITIDENDIIKVKSIYLINYIYVYDLSAIKLQILIPNSYSADIYSIRSVVVIKIITTDGIYIKKVIIY